MGLPGLVLLLLLLLPKEYTDLGNNLSVVHFTPIIYDNLLRKITAIDLICLAYCPVLIYIQNELLSSKIRDFLEKYDPSKTITSINKLGLR